jgi:hypothetical protein
MPTTNALGAFTISTDGGVQGTQMDDPETRWSLRSGIVAQTETIPMWGGVLIYEQIPTPGISNPRTELGPIIGRATTLTATNAKGASGFSLFNQVYNAPITPQSGVPAAPSGMTFNYQRLGSGARIWVACDPTLADLEGGSVGQNVSWDFNNQVLQPYDASTATITINSATWASTSGGQITVAVTNWTGAWQPTAGDILNISGGTNTGTGGAAAFNSDFAVVSATSTGAVLAAPAAAGYYGTLGGSPVFNFGTGALNVRVDAIIPTGNMVVSYSPSTGYINWNYNGCAALLTI